MYWKMYEIHEKKSSSSSSNLLIRYYQPNLYFSDAPRKKTSNLGWSLGHLRWFHTLQIQDPSILFLSLSAEFPILLQAFVPWQPQASDPSFAWGCRHKSAVALCKGQLGAPLPVTMVSQKPKRWRVAKKKLSSKSWIFIIKSCERTKLQKMVIEVIKFLWCKFYVKILQIHNSQQWKHLKYGVQKSLKVLQALTFWIEAWGSNGWKKPWRSFEVSLLEVQTKEWRKYEKTKRNTSNEIGNKVVNSFQTWSVFNLKNL